MSPLLHLLVLRSADLARVERFYAALGIRLVREKHGTGPEHLVVEIGDLVFEIYPEEGSASTLGARIGLRVPSVAAAIAAAESAGGTLITPAKNGPWGLRGVVADPDGHRVDLVEQSDNSVVQLAVAYVSPGPRDPIEWIDWMIDVAISKPRNFKDTPEELEAMLWAYDEVRTHLVTQSDSSQALHSYGNFLMTTECEAASYCVRQRLEGRLPTIEGLCDLWRAFIAWRIWRNSLPLSQRSVPQMNPPGT